MVTQDRVARGGAGGDRAAAFVSARLLALVCLGAGPIVLAPGAEAQCSTCVGDADGDRTVTINELIQAVNNALFGCDRPTATPTSMGSTAAPTATPTPPAGACAVTPGAWSAPAWATTAAEALALRAQLGALTGADAMRGAEQGTAVLGGVAHLVELYEAGSPSLADVTNPAFAPIVAESFAEFVALIDAGPGDPISESGAWTPGPNGGIYGTSPRGMNAGGIEVRQIVEKGLFAGGALYHYALRLTEGGIDPASVDALAAAWGANETLDPAGTLVHSASYSWQMGFFAAMAAALSDAKAFAADGACVAERDAAIRTFFRVWEHSMFARIVFYANRGLTLERAATSDNDAIEAVHQLSEGMALAMGYRGLPHTTSGPLANASRTVTDTSIDDILTAFRVNLSDLNSSTTGFFINEPDGFAAAVTAIEAVVSQVYGLDEAEIAAYRNPTSG